MERPVFSEHDFAPARVYWNKLILDPDRPYRDQLETAYDDLIYALFPNHVSLDVSWHPERDGGEFSVALAQNPYDGMPFFEQSCRSISDLQKKVKEAIEVARARPSIRRHLVDEQELRPCRLELDELVLDPLTPLESQWDALKERLVEIRYSENTRVLTVGWFPEHASNGEFVVTVRRDPVAAPTTILWEQRCRDIPSLLDAIKTGNQIGQKSGSDQVDKTATV